MDQIAAYRDVGNLRRGGRDLGATHETVKRIIEAHEVASAGEGPAVGVPRARTAGAPPRMLIVW